MCGVYACVVAVGGEGENGGGGRWRGVDGSGMVGEWVRDARLGGYGVGGGLQGRVRALLWGSDACRSARALCVGQGRGVRRARWRVKRAAARLRWRAREAVRAAHHRCVLHAVQATDLLGVGDLDPHVVAQRAHHTVARAMLSLSLASLRRHMVRKAGEYGVRGETVREGYTSSVCGTCFRTRANGGSSVSVHAPMCAQRPHPAHPTHPAHPAHPTHSTHPNTPAHLRVPALPSSVAPRPPLRAPPGGSAAVAGGDRRSSKHVVGKGGWKGESSVGRSGAGDGGSAWRAWCTWGARTARASATRSRSRSHASRAGAKGKRSGCQRALDRAHTGYP